MQRRAWWLVCAVVAAGLTAGPLALVASPGGALNSCPGGTIVVNSTADTATPGTLRTAIGTATTANGGTICIDTTAVTSPIMLTSSLPAYTGSGPLTIDGNGATVNANGNRAIASTSSALLTVDGLTVTDSNSAANGGGINASGSLTVTNSTITNSTASGNGGGLFSGGDLVLSSSTVSGNTAGGSGGGIYDVSGTVMVTNSTINNNTASGAGADGGGIAALLAVTVTNSTISGNTTPGLGGGIGTSGLATITSSTISNNSATGTTSEGGGVAATTGVVLTNSTVSGNTLNASGGGGGGGISANTVTATNSTISGNSAGSDGDGGGIESGGAIHLVYVTLVQNSSVHAGANLDGTSLTSFGSVVAQAAGGGSNCNVSGTTTSGGYNFTDDPSAGASCKFGAPTDHVGASNNPLLGALAANGGPTSTMLPQAGSPLIDGVAASACQTEAITKDQRGFARPDTASPACDIGAVEVQPSALTTLVTAQFTG